VGWCNEQDAQAIGDRRKRRGRQSLVEIIRKKLRAKQLPHASDRPFANLCGSNNGIGMGNSWVPSTNKHVVKKAENMQTDYPVRQDKMFQHGYIPYPIYKR
jgi:hypothetical protein